ncbi:MAG: DUF1576 domain-containing protein, partial [Firmicutes bacterium]|nr:DUF1576 domain-containing protein [Bacillota bacterium]
GFTSGIIGTFFIGVLRSFGIEVDTVFIISSGNNKVFAIILYSIFAAMFLFGFKYNNCGLKGIKKILRETGRLGTDFVDVGGFCSVLMNMALLGVISTSYVLLVGGELSGPVIGGILTVVGFGACGKHPKNILPVLGGIYLVGLLNSDEVFSPIALMAALFGTTLAPVSGHFGPFAGMIAGAFHMTLTMNISNLHAGMNLYNNGFSGGFVAAALVPIFEGFASVTKKERT